MDRRSQIPYGVLAWLIAGFWMVGVILHETPFRQSTTYTPEMSRFNAMRHIGYGLLMYAQDNDDYFPPANLAWEKAVLPYVREPKLFVKETPFPGSSGGHDVIASTVAMNALVAERRTTTLRPKTVLLAETHYRSSVGVNGTLDFTVPRYLTAPDRGVQDISLGLTPLGTPGAVRWKGRSIYVFLDGSAGLLAPGEVADGGTPVPLNRPGFHPKQ